MTEAERQSLQHACDDLIKQQQTLLLSSRSEDGRADISYAPYLREGGKFYILVSELAKHTKNLLDYPHASVLFIEPEAEAANLFARKRLTIDCQVQEIHKTDPLYAQILDALTAKFGEIVGLLRSLPDFHLLALMPGHGQFVAGFGKAFAVDAAGCLQWATTN